MSTYKIIRKFMNHEDQIIEDGLTMEEAQAHCKDPETSSRSAISREAIALTEKMGPWFDGYEEE